MRKVSNQRGKVLGRIFKIRRLNPGGIGRAATSAVAERSVRRRNHPPVISSTSAHTKPDFHCEFEWGVLNFSEKNKLASPA